MVCWLVLRFETLQKVLDYFPFIKFSMYIYIYIPMCIYKYIYIYMCICVCLLLSFFHSFFLVSIFFLCLSLSQRSCCVVALCTPNAARVPKQLLERLYTYIFVYTFVNSIYLVIDTRMYMRMYIYINMCVCVPGAACFLHEHKCSGEVALS